MNGKKSAALFMTILMALGAVLGFAGAGAQEALGKTTSSREDLPDLAVAAITFDNDRPFQGDEVEITVQVENKGDATAATGHLAVYNNHPDDGGLLIGEQALYSLAPHVTQPYAMKWGTIGFRGTYNIYAAITDIFPEESNLTGDNNNATSDLLVFKKGYGGDIIAEGNQITDIQGDKLMKNYIAAFDNSHVTFQNCTMNFSQDHPYQYSLVVADTAYMNIYDCHIYSEHAFFIKVMGNGILSITNSILDKAIIQSNVMSNGSSIEISNTIVDGGLTTAARNVEVYNSTFNGDLTLTQSHAAFYDTYFNYTPTTSWITDSHVTFKDSILEGVSNLGLPEEELMNVDGTSNVTLTNTTAPAFWVEGNAVLWIYRYLFVNALDLTELPIANAGVTVYFQDVTGEDVAYGVSDKNGRVEFSLVTDKIYANYGQDPFANYELNGSVMGSDNVEYRAFTTVTLPIYNFTDGIVETTKEIDLWFEPLPRDKPGPKFRVPRENQARVEAKDYGEYYTQESGVIIEQGGTLVLENSILYVKQSMDFEVDVIIKGTMEFHNGGIYSNYKLNVYVIDGTMTGVATGRTDFSYIHVNAIIGLGGAVVDLKSMDMKCDFRGHYAKLDVQGAGSSMEGHFRATVSTMTFDGVSIIDHTVTNEAVLTGSEVAIKNGDFIVNKFRVDTTTKASFDGLRIRGNPDGSRDGHSENSTLFMSSSACSIQNSDIEVGSFGFDCDSLAGTDSIINRPLTDFAKGTGHTLINFTTPNIIVSGTAMVTTHWKLSVTVLNLRGTPLSGITVNVVPHDPSLPSVSKQTNNKGMADFYLKASVITEGGKQFVGNYQVTVQGKGDTQTESVSMITNVEKTFMLNYFPPVLFVRATELNVSDTQVTAPETEVTVNGRIMLEYEGGVLDAGSAIPVNTSIRWGFDDSVESAPAIFTNTTGYFSMVISLPYGGSLMDYNDWITVEDAVYTAPDGSTKHIAENRTIAIKVLPENISSELTIEDLRVNKIEYNYPDDQFIIISGIVKYSNGEYATGATVTAQLLGSLSMETTVGPNGAFNVTVQIPEGIDPSQPAPNIKVTATITGDYYDPTAVHTGTLNKRVKVNVGEKATEEPLIPFMVLIAIVAVVVIIVVALVVVFMFMQKTWGVLVECGECGAFIKENLSKCPKCGTEFENEVVKCSECGAWINSLATECPKCGVAFKEVGKDGAAKPPQVGGPGQPAPPPQPGQAPVKPMPVAKPIPKRK